MELSLDFSFFAALAIFAFFDDTGLGLTSLVMCMLHEAAHLIVMLLLNIPPCRVKFYGAGIAISARRLEYRADLERCAVYAAGCALNFALAAVFWHFGNGILSAVNLCIGMLNMLPIGGLDGARLLRVFAERFFEPDRADFILKVCGMISAALCVIALFFVKGKVGVSAVISGAYLLLLSALRPD